MNNNVKNIYQYIAITFLTVVILLVIINLLISKFYQKDGYKELARYFYEEVIQKDVYLNHELSIQVDTNYIKEVVENHCQFIEQGEYRYYPNIEYTLNVFASKHINIVQDSFDLPNRLTTSKSIDTSQAFSIYCLGGSTTYGDFVSDNHTWPSFLSEQLNHNTIVKNYGCHAYTPTSATNLLIELIKLGHRPSLVIFLDVVNLGPQYHGSLLSKNIYRRYLNQTTFSDFLYQSPIVQIINSKYNRLQKPANKINLPIQLADDNRLIINRFIENVRVRNAIAKIYQIQILNFYSPIH